MNVGGKSQRRGPIGASIDAPVNLNTLNDAPDYALTGTSSATVTVLATLTLTQTTTIVVCRAYRRAKRRKGTACSSNGINNATISGWEASSARTGFPPGVHWHSVRLLLYESCRPWNEKIQDGSWSREEACIDSRSVKHRYSVTTRMLTLL